MQDSAREPRRREVAPSDEADLLRLIAAAAEPLPPLDDAEGLCHGNQGLAREGA